MSVGIVCPNCNAPLTFHRPPVLNCPQCHKQFPESLQRSAEAALSQQTVQRPLLLTVGMYCSPGIGILMLFTLLAALTGSGSFDVNGQAVSGPEFFQQAGLMLAVLGLVLIGVGVALYVRHPFARWLMLVYWFLDMAGLIGVGWSGNRASGAAVGAAQGLFFLVIAYWYLFVKPNVVAYFRALELQRAAGALEQPGSGA